MEDKVLTRQQQKAIHLYFKHMADELTNAGLDIRKTLKADFDVPWNAYLVKEFMWRPVQKEVCGKESTTKITTQEINQIFDVITKAIGEKTGLYIEFPSIEALIHKLEN